LILQKLFRSSSIRHFTLPSIALGTNL